MLLRNSSLQFALQDCCIVESLALLSIITYIKVNSGHLFIVLFDITFICIIGCRIYDVRKIGKVS